MNPDAICILFSGETMSDASPAGQKLFAEASGTFRTDWEKLRATLAPHFREMPLSPMDLEDTISLSLPPVTEGLFQPLIIESHKGQTRVLLAREPQPSLLAAPTSAAPDTRLTLAADLSPCPTWCARQGGRVVWANRAYLALRPPTCPSSKDGEIPSLFDPRLLSDTQMRPQRLSLAPQDNQPERWFEITTTRFGDETLHHAMPLDEVIRAETLQRSFVQTLTKTFANLSIGLAIFDRDKRLALFNPALLDLTALPVDFLTSRPTMLSFFDAMRDIQTMPEPKDFKAWRQNLLSINSTAPNREFLETWSLPGGQIYRVTGRAQPDGTLAFLIEDISDEISLTRHFREELGQTRAILEHLHQGVALFSPSGKLSLRNAAYDTVWPSADAALTENADIAQAIAGWRELCAPTPFWAELLAYTERRTASPPEMCLLHRKDGRLISVVATRLHGGACLLLFGSPLLPVRAPKEAALTAP